MAVAPLKSAGVTGLDTQPPTLLPAAQYGGALKQMYDTVTITTAGTGTIELMRLGAGKKLIFPDLSRVWASNADGTAAAGNSGADLHIGIGAYVATSNGNTVSAVANTFLNDDDLGNAARDLALVLPARGPVEVDSKGGFSITALIDTADILVNSVISLSLVYADLK